MMSPKDVAPLYHPHETAQLTGHSPPAPLRLNGAAMAPVQTSARMEKAHSSPALPCPGSVSRYSPDAGLMHTHVQRALALLGPPEEQLYLGKNAVYRGGRIVLGPDKQAALGALVLIWAPSILFFAGLSPYVPLYWSLVYAALACAATVFFLLTATTDPGIIRRNRAPALRQEPPQEVVVLVRQAPVLYRYCATCHIYRDPRASHCPVCDNCVLRFDHHCPWTGTCIGLRNYRFFCWFLMTVIALSLYTVLCSNLVVVFRFLNSTEEPHDYLGALRSLHFIPLVLMIYSVIILISVGPLCGFHLYLIATAQTTRESFKERTEMFSTYSRGIPRNCVASCCQATIPFPPLRPPPRDCTEMEMDSVPPPSGII